MRRRGVAALVLLVLAWGAPALAKKPKAVEAPPAAEEGGPARGKFKNGEELSPFQYAYAVALRDRRSGSPEVHVVLADKRLAKAVLDDLSELSRLGEEGEVRAVELVTDGAGKPLRLLFHHPGLPAGLAVQGVEWKIEVSGLPDGPVKGSLLFDDDGYSWTTQGSFEAPVYRPAEAPALAIDPDLPPAERALRELSNRGLQATEEALVEAAFDGDEEIAGLLLAAGVPGSASGPRGSALEDAVTQKHLGIARALLAAGADPDERLDPYGTSLLHRAVDSADPGFVAALLEAGADPSVANQYRITPLMSASLEGRLEMVELLVAAGAKVTARDTSGGTALSSAVLRGHADVARALIRAGADVKRDRSFLLELARRDGGHPEIEKLILEAAPGD